MSTKELIEKLGREAAVASPLRSPAYLGMRLIAVLAVYGVGAQLVLGVREDLAVQFTRPMFALEVVALAALILTSALGAVFAMYPDAHQKPWILRLPLVAFVVVAAIVLGQLWGMPLDPRMVVPPPGAHSLECALCIASVAIIPSGLIFRLLRKGASVCPREAGTLVVLAAAGIGCLTLRLAEANDALMHLVVWHYLPTCLFAGLGAGVGKRLLQW